MPKEKNTEVQKNEANNVKTRVLEGSQAMEHALHEDTQCMQYDLSVSEGKETGRSQEERFILSKGKAKIQENLGLKDHASAYMGVDAWLTWLDSAWKGQLCSPCVRIDMNGSHSGVVGAGQDKAISKASSQMALCQLVSGKTMLGKVLSSACKILSWCKVCLGKGKKESVIFPKASRSIMLRMMIMMMSNLILQMIQNQWVNLRVQSRIMQYQKAI